MSSQGHRFEVSLNPSEETEEREVFLKSTREGVEAFEKRSGSDDAPTPCNVSIVCRHRLSEPEERFVQQILLVQESLIHGASESSARLLGVVLSEFCRYLIAVHQLPRREKGYGLEGDPNKGYELIPNEELERRR